MAGTVLALSVGAILVLAPVAVARMIAPWGSSLSATPTLDTANGASYLTKDQPTTHAVLPYPHDGADFTVWNTRLAHRSATAPRGGQVRAIRIKGCAIRETTAQTLLSGSTPVNTINFQSLTRQPNGSYKAGATAPGFQMPFCSNSANPASGPVSTSTITTFRPIHLCVAKGDTVSFYDIGGFIPNNAGPAWYPEGVPFRILARAPGSAMDSFADADISGGVYTPGATPRGANSGWGSESREELLLQVIEGVGADAYGLCPGGTANEPANSNAIVCVYHPPYDGHRHCGRAADQARSVRRS